MANEMKQPLFEMLITSDLDGVFAVSLVDRPAIETDFILLSKEDKIGIDIKLEKIVDEKKRIVCGPALIPDLVIPRKNMDIVFSKETIQKISEGFLINNYKDNVTIQHKANINNINLVESWIVNDSKNDKASSLGFDVPNGTWMLSLKINNPDVWTEFIESGTLKGFSIEGSFTNREVKMMEECDDEHCDHTHHVHECLSEEDADLFGTALLALGYSRADLGQPYKWVLGANEEHCPSCTKYAAMEPLTLDKWVRIAIPATLEGSQIINGSRIKTSYHVGSPNGKKIVRSSNSKKTGPVYGTFCESNCQCRLVLATGGNLPKPGRKQTPSNPSKRYNDAKGYWETLDPTTNKWIKS